MENRGEKGLFAGAVSGNRPEISAGGIKRRNKRKKTQKDAKRQGKSRIVEERRANKTGLHFCRPVLLRVRPVCPVRPAAHISVYMIFSDS